MLCLTQDYLKGILRYDPESGHFFWLKKICSRVVVGRQTGWIDKNGYVVVGFDNKKTYAHRLAWFYMTGRWPSQVIDHIDGNRHNNSWSNLREATGSQNLMNSKVPKNNTSGFRGVSRFVQNGKWRAHVVKDHKQRHLGYFDTFEEACEAARKGAETHFGEFCGELLPTR